METLKKTPLNDTHKEMKAKMTPFGGWEMPLQYSSIIDEHMATRTKAGLFDVSHMGQIFIENSKDLLLPFLEKLTCNTVGTMKDGQVQYNAVLNEQGGIVDDITLYRFNEEKYMICSNASNFESVYNFLIKYDPGVKITNASQDYHLLAIQGPLAEEILSEVFGFSLSDINYYNFVEKSIQSETLIISRTGYTGEDGFEIYSSNAYGVQLWKKILEVGLPRGLKPIGLGARDTLRIEMRYPLYGHELSMIRNPVESGISWIVKEKAIKYFGYDNIIDQKKNGCEIKMIGIVLEGAGVLREHFPIFSTSGREIGLVTSGTFSPVLKKGIGIALVISEELGSSEEVMVEIRGEKKKAILQKGSFVPTKVKKNN
ncbi:MAG: glycine cleavage system aminomethyltransferase GcvT [Leptospiraceae bacterium]|nr:glycine cleavage system aminomethyltransferase GcvT [Leptospiraceae bacterium]